MGLEEQIILLGATMSLKKDFQLLDPKLTCFNYRLSYQTTWRKHLSFKTSLNSHDTSELDSLPNTWLTFHSIGLTESHKSQSTKSISTLGTYYTNGALLTSPRGGELFDSYTNT